MGAENLEQKYGGILPDKVDNFFPPLYNNDDHIQLSQAVEQESAPEPTLITAHSSETSD